MSVAEPALISSVIKSGGELIAKAKGASAVLIPRLEVRGNGTGNVLAFNLQVTNVGQAPAFGVQVGAPWHVLAANGTEEGRTTFWWEKRSPKYAKVLLRLREWLPAFTVSWLEKRTQFVTKDVGLVLAPGESTTMYFGIHRIRQGERASGLVLKTGDVIPLQLRWHNGPPGVRARLWKPCMTIPFAIHSHEGVSVSAHHRWGA